MLKKLLVFPLVLFVSLLSAQDCNELFISEYVEGYANNKALEIYNPTNSAINLSGYSIARFSNGNTSATPPSETPAYIIQLPDEMLASNDVFVVVIDLTDTDLWDSQFDKPAWNGYNLIDTLFDFVTGEPEVDQDGNILYGPQYIDGAAVFGDEYNEEYDLQGKADVFLCPDYDTNRAMYFNGNDAVALLTGTEIAIDGSNLVDVIGVIGEDPEDTIGEDAWVNEDGFWLTKDRTLVRNADVKKGRNTLTDVIFQSGGTFTGLEWESYPKNSFQYLGSHSSSCSTNATVDINEIAFTMFPNPTRGTVTVEAAENINLVRIYNLLGQELYTETIKNTNAKVNIDLSQFNTGMYTVSLTFDNNKISNQKLIVE